MTRENMAAFAAHQTAFWQALHADAEAEAAKLREEAIQLRAALTSREGQLQDQTAAIFALTKERDELKQNLDEEQRRRSKFQAVDAAACRFVKALRSGSDALEERRFLVLTVDGEAAEDRSSVTVMAQMNLDFEALRKDLTKRYALTGSTKSEVVADVLKALRERGLLRLLRDA